MEFIIGYCKNSLTCNNIILKCIKMGSFTLQQIVNMLLLFFFLFSYQAIDVIQTRTGMN